MTGCSAPARKAGSSGPSADDLRFLERFERCTLPESEWTHLAHVRIAWTCLELEAPDAALQRIRRGILRYNTEVLGRPHKYHETVTEAFARLVAARRKTGERFGDFARRIDDILDPDRPKLLEYYSPERLHSYAARDGFVEPDRKPLPPLG
mgnify:CR=1 FL=1